MSNDKKFKKIMGAKRFDVEHALSLYALSFYSLPAKAIYNDNLAMQFGEGLKDCHIYLIGVVPKLDLKGVRQEDQSLIVDLEVLGKLYSVMGAIHEGLTLKQEDDLWYLSDVCSNRYVPSDEAIFEAFVVQNGLLEFNVVYVGQAYGNEGSRNAVDRLRKHETLQRIALNGAPDGYRIQVLLIEINSFNQMFTFMNPFAADKSQGDRRIKQGVDKLFGTNEHERITLYEASLISYFQPFYNKEFKNSFPSTNLKVLADCYKKDFSMIVAEFCFDEPPFLLYSQDVHAGRQHVIKIDLHKEADRKVFFAVE